MQFLPAYFLRGILKARFKEFGKAENKITNQKPLRAISSVQQINETVIKERLFWRIFATTLSFGKSIIFLIPHQAPSASGILFFEFRVSARKLNYTGYSNEF